MSLPVNTQIKRKTLPEVRWGVHFVHEDVVSDYGPGDEAKAAAEETVKSWADSPYPAKLVSQVVLPWSEDENLVVPLVLDIREARSDPSAVVILRGWLEDNGYETEDQRKTSLRDQVPLVKQMRKTKSVNHAMELFNIWLGTHGYRND